MIKYDLRCDAEHTFEGWFRSIADFDDQAEAAAVECPVCGSTAVQKAIMAPAVRSSKKAEKISAEKAMRMIAAKAKEHIASTCDYVGDQFAKEARKMHDGEAEHRPIWGEATPQEAKALIEDGAPVAPIPPAFAPTPPRKVN